MADLVTLSEMRTALGVDVTNTRDDAKWSFLIPLASQAIINYAERDFGSALVTETRPFEYDYSGYLDIDDCTTVTAVALSTPPFAPDITLTDEEWVALPHRRDDSPVYFYIYMPSYRAGYSAEMGFTRNADVLAREGRLSGGLRDAVQVTATWGWPDVPGDVKLATIWTVQDWATKPSSEGQTAEAIADYSRSWGGRAGGTGPNLALTNRVRDLLENYRKQRV